jgi:hypothetical protein
MWEILRESLWQSSYLECGVTIFNLALGEVTTVAEGKG